ncbi:putative plastid-lipid-associated protein 13, chloroplastic [Zea mays]|uniref:Putative plastid-lipid-associated protein 13, chloroplastic n=1 Tax=Zea mays TaxID=4577 RepID=A0A3L6GBC5_MAIZE|nr:putative plastid-lipid-associated protein 13, chloroplastic [Zea mays]
MAASVALTPAYPAFLPVPFRVRRDGRVRLSPRRPRYSAGRCRAMAQTFQGGAAASYAREMERLSAKESLLLAFKDAGGFDALVSGKTTEMQRIDVNERIVGLERLNPTPRPTTSPFLEGRWNFEWFGDSSPGAFAARLLFERSPTSVAHFMGLDVLIKDGYSKLSSNLKFLNTIQSKFLLTTQLSVEGPIRMKEEYVEGLIAIPRINEESLPEQLKGLLGQTAGALQQLPSPIREAVSEGLKLPLGKSAGHHTVVAIC